jgi:hypothetical protein
MYYTKNSKQQHGDGHYSDAREHDASGDCINERHDLYSFTKNYHIEAHSMLWEWY